MIAFLYGKLVEKEPTFVILDNQGTGYKINISLNTFAQIKEADHIRLFTYLQVREDAHTLYGFSEKKEKETFLSLINVNGVGANTAMVILSCMSSEELHTAILNEDVDALQRIKGIGKKSAQRMIIELKDKLKKIGMKVSSEHVKVPTSIHDEACTALTTLGVSKAVAEKTIHAIMLKVDKTMTLEKLIKLALKSL